jgi:hypothetical protein
MQRKDVSYFRTSNTRKWLSKISLFDICRVTLTDIYIEETVTLCVAINKMEVEGEYINEGNSVMCDRDACHDFMRLLSRCFSFYVYQTERKTGFSLFISLR